MSKARTLAVTCAVVMLGFGCMVTSAEAARIHGHHRIMHRHHHVMHGRMVGHHWTHRHMRGRMLGHYRMHGHAYGRMMRHHLR